jgi:signal transduction histidine kinase
MIDEGLSRISDLSRNMLKYAREWKVEAEPVDLRQMARKIAVAASKNTNEPVVSVRTEINDALPLVTCDPRLIHMCIMDIVSNAVDACDLKEYSEDQGPEIVIRVFGSADGQNAIIEIEDNGAGMSEEIMANVFTPFFSTKKKWGTGLGLALTSRIINLHNGQITVESELDEGTVFRITLPLNGRVENLEDGR